MVTDRGREHPEDHLAGEPLDQKSHIVTSRTCIIFSLLLEDAGSLTFGML